MLSDAVPDSLPTPSKPVSSLHLARLAAAVPHAREQDADRHIALVRDRVRLADDAVFAAAVIGQLQEPRRERRQGLL
jgi:hypothetical protein